MVINLKAAATSYSYTYRVLPTPGTTNRKGEATTTTTPLSHHQEGDNEWLQSSLLSLKQSLSLLATNVYPFDDDQRKDTNWTEEEEEECFIISLVHFHGSLFGCGGILYFKFPVHILISHLRKSNADCIL